MSAKILIVGTGALASFFAAKLSEAGTDVTMLGSWPSALQALKQDGVRLIGAEGGETAFPVTAVDDPADCRDAALALVLVKSWQTERAANQLQECLGPGGLALTLQNGLGNYEKLSAALGADRAALGVTTTGATLEAPGRVRPGGEGTVSVQRHPRIASLSILLRSAGFDVEETADPEGLAWSKLVINAAINPLTALLGVPNGALLERRDARKVMGLLAQEVAAVAAERGTSLSFSDPVGAAEDVARRTAANHSSMLQDIQRGAPTEIDAISGAVVREGRRLGVSTPVNAVAWRLVRALAQGGRPAGDE